ncbi:TetR/AcrR family transcriptional regulator [Rhodococcoides kroppenstedtii]|uniref:TetR/AcrR family transcriptional regulator n=1 Tax=Rhodococcoides kroppenstedtii TaxID=293050 RepID=UPI003628E915
MSTASELIAVSGFRGVSLSAVAQACGISKPTVLHYFPAMPELLFAVLRQRDSILDQEMRQVTVDSPEQARRFLDRVVGQSACHPGLVRLYHVVAAEALDPQHPAHEYMSTRAARARNWVQGIVAWKSRPDAAALELLAFWEGLEMLWLRQPDLDFLAVWGNFCDRFFLAD